MPRPDSLDIALLLYPGCMPAGLLAAADLLTATALRSGARHWRVHWVGLQAGPVACAHGVRLRAQESLGDGRWHAVMLPGFWAASPEALEDGVASQQPLQQALRALGAKVPLWTWCTGVALAAGAGRLDGEAATGTWWMAPWLSRRHPKVDWQWQQPVVSGPRVATASGVHGHLPLLSEQMARRVDPPAWRDVQRLMVLPRPRPPASVFDTVQTLHGSHPLLARLRRHVERLPAREATLPVLAEAMAVSPRTLAREVSEAAGLPAGRYVRLVKLYQAGEHLLAGTPSVAQVCDRLGFADESSFRRSFKAATGLTVAAYVDRYR